MQRFILFFFILFAFTAKGFAHELSNGYLTLNYQQGGLLKGELLLKPEDIGQAANLDSNNDGQLQWGEVLDNHSFAEQYIASSLQVKQGETKCDVATTIPSMRSISAESLIVYPLNVSCQGTVEISIMYQGIFEVTPTHKLLTTIKLEQETLTTVIAEDKRILTLTPAALSITTQFFEMVYQGIWHIFIGLDHILFLVATLLTVNLARNERTWKKEDKKRDIVKSTVILVSAFTLAHSITLTATALDIITLDSRWVELGIAISVMLTALNNIFPVVFRLGFLTFGFGLLHGMGFASVFAELNAQSNSLVMSVAAFNIGVEIGQLAIVAVLLPILMLARNWHVYAKTIMPFASSVIAIIALNWTLQRW
ncbi:HupE/UreJ family protein [Alteromonas hispanica]|uniref:HupE/UreJ family protein n=1 Tax=Alteromonas hispanica TaxID=315421 RepID=A0A6L9MXU1_9ALTE|nr:HupE/UreJ family protein [Alteromonas hispanica]NDW22631.1 HupE/UreJ family protein [Alteromonas hispanica]